MQPETFVMGAFAVIAYTVVAGMYARVFGSRHRCERTIRRHSHDFNCGESFGAKTIRCDPCHDRFWGTLGGVFWPIGLPVIAGLAAFAIAFVPLHKTFMALRGPVDE